LKNKIKAKFELDRISRAVFKIDKKRNFFTVCVSGNIDGENIEKEAREDLSDFMDFFQMLAAKITPEINRRGHDVSEILHIYWLCDFDKKIYSALTLYRDSEGKNRKIKNPVKL